VRQPGHVLAETGAMMIKSAARPPNPMGSALHRPTNQHRHSFSPGHRLKGQGADELLAAFGQNQSTKAPIWVSREAISAAYTRQSNLSPQNNAFVFQWMAIYT